MRGSVPGVTSFHKESTGRGDAHPLKNWSKAHILGIVQLREQCSRCCCLLRWIKSIQEESHRIVKTIYILLCFRLSSCLKFIICNELIVAWGRATSISDNLYYWEFFVNIKCSSLQSHLLRESVWSKPIVLNQSSNIIFALKDQNIFFEKSSFKFVFIQTW